MIYVHPVFLSIVFIGLISGLFKNIIFFVSIIFVHELGHFLMAKHFGWNVDKICFYPYGGFTKFNDGLNRPKYQELIIMLSGPIFQIVYFLVVINFLTLSEIVLFSNYHYSILLFNLMPIYPLDGGKLLNLFFNCFFSFRKGFKATIILSYICLFVFICILFFRNLSFSLSTFLVLTLLICKLTKEYRKEKFYFNKFLLERYLSNYKFRKYKVIKGIGDMSRDYKHVIFDGSKTSTEKEILSSYFSTKRQSSSS